MTTIEPLLSSPEAHAVLKEHGYRISPSRFRAWAVDGKLPSHKVGKYRYFRRSELLAWIEASLTPQPGQGH